LQGGYYIVTIIAHVSNAAQFRGWLVRSAAGGPVFAAGILKNRRRGSATQNRFFKIGVRKLVNRVIVTENASASSIAHNPLFFQPAWPAECLALVHVFKTFSQLARLAQKVTVALLKIGNNLGTHLTGCNSGGVCGIRVYSFANTIGNGGAAESAFLGSLLCSKRHVAKIIHSFDGIVS